MERLNLVENGVIRLPPGFRFLPTDEELVLQYLKRKVFAHQLPASIIPEVNVSKLDPWILPGDSKRERYFFSPTREVKCLNGNKPNRATRSGYWKASGTDKRVLDSRSKQVAGMKKTLIFYIGKPEKGIATDWIMHEYRLVGTQNAQDSMGDWILCRIYLKRRLIKNEGEIVQPWEKNREEFGVASSSSSSSSASSGITDDYSIETDHEESSSSDSASSSYCYRET